MTRKAISPPSQVKNIGKRYQAALLLCTGTFDGWLETLLLLFPEGMFDGGLGILLSHAIVSSAGIITSDSVLAAKLGFFVPHFLQNLTSTLISFWQLVQRDI